MILYQKVAIALTNMHTGPSEANPATREAAAKIGDELAADTDEPPDERQRTPRPTPVRPAPLDTMTKFAKKHCEPCSKKESLLTQALRSESDSESDDDMRLMLRRGVSTTSTCSNASLASTDLTSDGDLASPSTGATSPSPPHPSAVSMKDPCFILASRQQRAPTEKTDEPAVEAELGRKRCISFACGKQANMPCTAARTPPCPAKPAAARSTTIKFVACDAKATGPHKKPRMASPPPPTRRLAGLDKGPARSHRGSDSTVRNESPKSVRKGASVIRHTRKDSENSDFERRGALCFHEFPPNEEVEEWTEEQTCHRCPLTVPDTLKIEHGLRKLGEEVAEEEALEEEEEDDDGDDGDDDEDDEDDDADDDDADDDDADAEHHDLGQSVVSGDSIVSDAGFQSDDEHGFAGSDDESDGDSDCPWWAPRDATVSSGERPKHIRPLGHRSLSDSSNCSADLATAKSTKRTHSKRKKPLSTSPHNPELPDSTDFVCGTLDEDRPLEEAYYSALEQRRAAKHKKTPQDIDPTFPTSDPEIDEEEDEEDGAPDRAAEDSDHHVLFHGQLDQIDGFQGRGRGRSAFMRSPITSPKRLRSPPPLGKRALPNRSPPPRHLHCRSPKRLRSPPPVGHTSPAFMGEEQHGRTIEFASTTQGPRPTVVASLPRPLTLFHHVLNDGDDDDSGDGCETANNDTFKRGPMDIKAGTALKRQRRKEKLYQKHCRKACKEKERRPAPGKGAERMREVGMGIAAYKGKKPAPVHVLSY